MKLIYFQGDDDFGAVNFHNAVREKKFNLKKLAKDLVSKKDKEMDIEWKDGRHKISGWIKLLEFKDVDPEFIIFIRSYIQDYDTTKCSDFFIIKE